MIMPLTMNRRAFSQLLAEDLDWLLRQPRTLERDHIEMVLKDAPRAYYDQPAPTHRLGEEVSHEQAQSSKEGESSEEDRDSTRHD